jgi:hypothetical protein
MTVSVPSVVEIYLCDPTGVRIECLDYITEYEYGKVANSPAPFRLRLPSKFDRSKIKLDNIVEIWRGYGPGTLKLDYCGFVRAWVFADDAGQEYTELYGLSSMELLARRITKDFTGIRVVDHTDDMIKAYVKDTLGSDAGTGRDLTSVGGGFTIQIDLADGPSHTRTFAYKNMLEIAQEICDASFQAGTELYFDIVPVISSSVTGALAFQLQTFTDQRGDDRTWDSSKPVFVGNEWGNFQNGSLEFDYSEEVNYAYVLGQGEGGSRETAEVSDTSRLGMSIWNRREGSKDARGVDYGDTAALTGEGNTYLRESMPKFRFGGEIIETPTFRYGRDWGFGDRVTSIYAGYQRDAMISKVLVSRDSSGQESITASLLVEE